MPTIEPILPQGTISVQQNTQMPRAEFSKIIEAQTQILPKESSNPPVPQTTEAPTEEKPSPIELDQKKLRALLFREKQLFNSRKKLETEQKAFEEKVNKYKTWIEAGELSGQNKLEALAKTGITYEDLTQQIINNGQVPPAQIAEIKAQEIARREIDAFKKEQAELSMASQKQQYSQGIKQLENEVKFVVDRDNKYPLVKETGSYQDIVKWIESEYHRTGRIVPVEDAIKRWESDALEGLQELAKLETIRDKFTSQEPKPTQSVTSTLSQKAAASIPSPRPITEKERRARAIEVFYGRQT